MNNSEGATVQQMPNWASARRNLYRIKSGAMPSSPQTSAEVASAFENEVIMHTFGMTVPSGGVPANAFYRTVFSNTNFAYCVFASQPIINRVAEMPQERRHYFMDGTFRVVPFGSFNQLLVIHASFFEKVGCLSVSLSLPLSQCINLTHSQSGFSFFLFSFLRRSLLSTY